MKFAKVMFLHLSVSHSVHWGGVPRQVHPLGQVHPPGRYTPWQVHTPPGKYPHGQVHPPGEVPPPPPGMYATQGRYTTPPRHVCPPGQVHHPSQAGTPRACKPSWVGTPQGRYTPSNACWDMVNKQSVYILLECILVDRLSGFVHTENVKATSLFSVKKSNALFVESRQRWKKFSLSD